MADGLKQELLAGGGLQQPARRKLYAQRFWLALVFSAWGLVQSAMWNIYRLLATILL
jgi:hypothetical protein